MSARRLPTIRRPRPVARRGGSSRSARSRLLLAVAAVVALLGTAWVIGRPRTDGPSSASIGSAPTTDATSAGPGGTAGSASSGEDLAPATTIPTGGGAASEVGSGADGSRTSAESAAGDVGAIETDTAPVADTDTTTATDALAPNVIRTGSIELVVADGRFRTAVTKLTALATGSGGMVASSETSSVDGAPWGTITLRVPAERFDDVVDQVRELGDVDSSSTSAQDVTGEVTDLTARLKALTAERDQITLILGKAETIPDILSVRDRLTAVQAEIEQLQGRQQVLADQTALSTLTVALREHGADDGLQPTAPPARHGFDRLWHDAAARFTDGGRSIALGLASMAPWLLLGLVLVVPARLLWRRAATADAHRGAETGAAPSDTGPTHGGDPAPLAG